MAGQGVQLFIADLVVGFNSLLSTAYYATETKSTDAKETLPREHPGSVIFYSTNWNFNTHLIDFMKLATCCFVFSTTVLSLYFPAISA